MLKFGKGSAFVESILRGSASMPIIASYRGRASKHISD